MFTIRETASGHYEVVDGSLGNVAIASFVSREDADSFIGLLGRMLDAESDYAAEQVAADLHDCEDDAVALDWLMENDPFGITHDADGNRRDW
jgi:hypothetical protein